GVAGFFLGLLLVAILFGKAGRRLLQASGKAGSTDTKSDELALLAAALTAAVAIAVHSLVDFNLHIRANRLLSALVMGLIAALVLSRPARSESQARGGRTAAARVGIGASALLCIVSALGLLWASRPVAKEAKALSRFAAAPWGSESAVQALQEAARVEPGNPETLLKLGEHFRQQSLLGEPGYESLAEESIRWHKLAAEAIPYSPWPPMRIGMCLDWLGRYEEAALYFEEMIRLDPNGKRARAMMGWHFFQVEDYAKSREWIRRARELPHDADPVATTYDQLLKARGY
ncbi:MAG TPA: hypothetical protein DCY13_17185, partial [Verrucomicrobiales bacterium]|nr:hypothetical protein [Verrucomicrobiales bacterium]